MMQENFSRLDVFVPLSGNSLIVHVYFVYSYWL